MFSLFIENERVTKLLNCNMNRPIYFWGIVSIMAVLSCLSCSNKDDENAIEITPKKLDETIENLFVSHKVIPLETNDNSLISEISDIKEYNDTYFILDKGKNQILLFDKDGHYLSKIYHQGRGHGEYVAITSYDISNDLVYVLSRGDSKINIYSFSGEFTNDIKLDNYYQELAVMDDYILLFSNYSNNSMTNYVKIDYKGKVIESWDPFKVNASYCVGENFLYKSGKTVLYCKPYDYNIYEYDGRNVVNIGHYAFKDQVRYSKNKKNNMEVISNLTKNTEYVKYFSSVSRIGNYNVILYPRFVDEYGICTFIFVHNVLDNKCYNYCFSIQGFQSTPFIGRGMKLCNNSIIGTMPAFIIHDIAERESINDSILLNLSDKDNPVLIRHELCLE